VHHVTEVQAALVKLMALRSMVAGVSHQTWFHAQLQIADYLRCSEQVLVHNVTEMQSAGLCQLVVSLFVL
jgi:hypothetical protein